MVVGPTASGKSGLAIEISKRFLGEVISADSRQVYRGLDIGTAKVTNEEMDGVPHHLVDIVDLNEVYTAADFKRDADQIINDMVSRNRLPIVAGGTFFYVDTLLGKVQLPEVPPNEDLRAKLEDKTTEELSDQLKQLDSLSYTKVDRSNKRRLIRAIEIATELGSVPESKPINCPYDALVIGLKVDKETLRERFKARAHGWLKEGLVKEVNGLLEQGVMKERLGEIGFEYLLTLELIDGQITEEEFVQKSIEKNWQYAKRQMTWLKRDENIIWFSKDDPEIFTTVASFLSN